jgi:adenosylhomocysteine nucleosidase
MRSVVIISANAEWRVFKECYPGLETGQYPFGEQCELALDGSRLSVFHGGWGKIAAAASAQYIIDHLRPGFIINIGTCGGFAGHVETGTIILVEQTVVYDILEQMGDNATALEHYSTTLELDWLPALLPHPVRRGILISADRDIVAGDIPGLVERHGAVAADWESGAIAWVAKRNQVRCLILRGVSDLVDAEGGEAYGNLELFHERTGGIMRELFRQLPAWLQAANPGEQIS